MTEVDGSDGTILRKGQASVRVVDAGQLLSVSDLCVPEGSPPGDTLELCSQVMRLAGGRPVWLAVADGNDKARRFFEAAGFKTRFLIMEKNNG